MHVHIQIVRLCVSIHLHLRLHLRLRLRLHLRLGLGLRLHLRLHLYVYVYVYVCIYVYVTIYINKSEIDLNLSVKTFSKRIWIDLNLSVKTFSKRTWIALGPSQVVCMLTWIDVSGMALILGLLSFFWPYRGASKFDGDILHDLGRIVEGLRSVDVVNIPNSVVEENLHIFAEATLELDVAAAVLEKSESSRRKRRAVLG